MVKIIKRGTRDIRECESCGCLFSFDKEDIKKNVITGVKTVYCPQCKKTVEIEHPILVGYINEEHE